MALTVDTNLIKSLQNGVPRGAPFDNHVLAQLGISSALAHHYLQSGWLVRLGRGVFMFPNDVFQRDACLKFLSTRITGFHVGGKTALAWRGVRHNLPSQEALQLWGEAKSVQLPEWFKSRFPARYTARCLFSKKLPRNWGLQSLPEAPDGPMVSEPERALLEMLSEVGVSQSVEEARNIMEGIRSLRLEVLQPLLKHCNRVKVARLCILWAEQLNLHWAAAARKAAGGKLGHNRWIFRYKNGTTLTLKVHE